MRYVPPSGNKVLNNDIGKKNGKIENMKTQTKIGSGATQGKNQGIFTEK